MNAKLKLLAIIGLTASATVASELEFYRYTERDSLKFELWLEASTNTWEETFICCALTNQGSQVFGVETDSGGTPAIYLDIRDRSGEQVPKAKTKTAEHLFTEPHVAPFGSNTQRLNPGESLVTRINVVRDLFNPSPSGVAVKATFNGGFSDVVTAKTFVLSLVLPDEPKAIRSPEPHASEFSGVELGVREDRLRDGLAPLPHLVKQIPNAAEPSKSNGTTTAPLVPTVPSPTTKSVSTPKSHAPAFTLPSVGSTSPTTPWPIVVAMIAAATGLLWLVLKRRTK